MKNSPFHYRDSHQDFTQNRSQTRGRCRRQGMALIVVLALVSITIALSYVMMRTQAVSIQMQQNLGRQDQARQAAMAGISVALQKMHKSDWAGVDSIVSGTLNSSDSYRVTYTTGDATLTAGDPDYDEYPYRVTLDSTGTSTDPTNSSIQAIWKIRVVVQLVRRAMGDEPDHWTALQQYDATTPYTVYQWRNADATVELPMQIKGPAHFQGKLKLCKHYPLSTSMPFDGLIDEVAIFDKALTANEIQAIYNKALQHNGVEDAYDDQNPVNWWRFNEGVEELVADNETVGGDDGNYEGGISGVTSVPRTGFGKCARFDGVDDYVDLGHFDCSGTAMTILLWFKADDFDVGLARFIAKASRVSVVGTYWSVGTVKQGSNTRLRFVLKTKGTTKSLIAAKGKIQTGHWIFVAAVYDGSQMKLYKNGGLVGHTSKTGAISTNSAASVWIGDFPPGNPRTRYFRGLETMHTDNEGDYRPFNDSVYLATGRTTSATIADLEDNLNITTHTVPVSSATPPSHPGNVSTYRLYPGGKEYTVQALSSSLSDVTFSPNPKTNPLGVFCRHGRLTLDDNVTIKGTIIIRGGSGDLRIDGENVHLQPVNLPPIEGHSTTRLPTALIHEDLDLRTGEGCSLNGMFIVWDDFELYRSVADPITITGRLLAREFQVEKRQAWDDVSDNSWRTSLVQFQAHKNNPPDPPAEVFDYFPTWVEDDQSLAPNPLLTIQPDSTSVTYHWQDWDEPIFKPHADDNGLIWDVIRWTDNP